MAMTNRIRWALTGLLATALQSSPGLASPGEGNPPQDGTSTRESPYARYAREHARSAEKKPSRVKPTPAMNRHSPRGSPQSGRH